MKIIKRIKCIGERFAAGPGFAVLTILCVAVITATALWTRHVPSTEPAPTTGNLPAAALWQQTLPAASPTPLPTQQPILWQAPLPFISVIRPYSPDTMLQSGVTRLWSVHPAVDLSADAGTPVVAMASGCILACGSDTLEGSWISISHNGGYVSRYAGLSLLGAFRPGDPISTGQTIGFVGNSILGESDLAPHLHLQVFRDGEPVDPMSLIQ